MQGERPVAVALVGMTVAALAGLADASDWARWRGQNGDGISTETQWAAEAVSSPRSVAWRVATGNGHSAVAVADGRLVTMGLRELGSGPSAVHEELVLCLDAETGREIWRYGFQTPPRPRFPGPAATPAIDGGLVYAIGRAGDVLALERSSGAVRWRRFLVPEGLAAEPDWGFCGSPVVDGDLLLINAGRSGLALDKRTGAVVWSSAAERGGLTTPVLLEHGNRRLALIGSSRELDAVDVASGEVVWSYPWVSYADPVLAGDRILLTAGQQRGQQGMALIELGDEGPSLVWHNDRERSFSFQSWLVIGKHAYGPARGRREALRCVDLETGETRWNEEMGQYVSLVGAGDRLVVVQGDGDLLVVKGRPDGYSEIAAGRVFRILQAAAADQENPNACWTAPVLADGRVYVRSTHGELVCVDVSS